MKRELEIKRLADFCVSCVTKPCQLGCPLNNDITSFIKNVKNDNYEEAFKILSIKMFRYIFFISIFTL